MKCKKTLGRGFSPGRLAPAQAPIAGGKGLAVPPKNSTPVLALHSSLYVDRPNLLLIIRNITSVSDIISLTLVMFLN